MLSDLINSKNHTKQTASFVLLHSISPKYFHISVEKYLHILYNTNKSYCKN